MRLLVACGDLERSGTQRVAMNYALAYRELGHEVGFLCYNGAGFWIPKVQEAGIPVFAVRDGAFQPALQAANAFAPEVIHIHRAGLARRLDGHVLRALRRPGRRVMETNVFARVDISPDIDLIDVHLQISEWCMWRWRKWLGRDCHRRAGVVVPNAVRAQDFQRASDDRIRQYRQSLGIPPDAFVCGRTGRPAGASWDGALIAAFAALARIDPSAHLLLLGFPDLLKSALAALPADIQNRCHALPTAETDEALSLAYSAMDCFVHCARSGESIGMVLTEAMLCGTPVVTTSRPHKSNSQVEVVGHRVGGLVAASRRDLPEALRQLWADKTLRGHIASTCRAHVLSRYDSRVVAPTALRVARMALEAPDRRSLIRRLAAARDLKTHVSNARVEALMRHAVGKPLFGEVVQKAIVHVPIVQRAVLRYLRWRLKFDTPVPSR